ncbi:EF-hand domain-containing protein [Sphingosinicella rhizophila]|uniref:EF-hand domain-containing protein n=1 Tax=Sphingosinicella rhizophila TaxID=3050082 RepID=A0ABU3QBC9_9SPHN|nr:hypothetical protein [Sphingosinicella sp. GR2756]MDT9600696.1 hypothetical protein [Sphingosinicella sp. GR2756]
MLRSLILPALIAVAAPAVLAAPDQAAAVQNLALGERPIRRAEVVAFVKKQFTRMDTNRDGSISPGEYRAYRATQPAKADAGLGYIGRSWFDKSDTDGDGGISPGEAQARPLRFFDLADVDGDGVATIREQSLASLFIGR